MTGIVSRRNVKSLSGMEKIREKNRHVSGGNREVKNTYSKKLHNRRTKNEVPLSKIMAASRANRKPYITRPHSKMAWTDERINSGTNGKRRDKVDSVLTSSLQRFEGSKSIDKKVEYRPDQFFKKVNVKSKRKLFEKDDTDKQQDHFGSSSARLNNLLERLRNKVDVDEII